MAQQSHFPECACQKIHLQRLPSDPRVRHFQIHQRRHIAQRYSVEDIASSHHELLAAFGDLIRAPCKLARQLRNGQSSQSAASATLALNAAVNLPRIFFANFGLILKIPDRRCPVDRHLLTQSFHLNRPSKFVGSLV
jgi:hypothetical protein